MEWDSKAIKFGLKKGFWQSPRCKLRATRMLIKESKVRVGYTLDDQRGARGSHGPEGVEAKIVLQSSILSSKPAERTF